MTNVRRCKSQLQEKIGWPDVPGDYSLSALTYGVADHISALEQENRQLLRDNRQYKGWIEDDTKADLKGQLEASAIFHEGHEAQMEELRKQVAELKTTADLVKGFSDVVLAERDHAWDEIERVKEWAIKSISSPWISVEDRLPDEGMNTIVTNGQGWIDWGANFHIRAGTGFYWMEVPDPCSVDTGT